jgi:hypothetical protein
MRTKNKKISISSRIPLTHFVDYLTKKKGDRFIVHRCLSKPEENKEKKHKKKKENKHIVFMQ